jgi:predicted small lipoprotein YifL
MTRKHASFAGFASLLVVAAALLAGCGQKGPLMLPDGEPTGTAVPSASDDEEERAADDERNGTENGADGG